MQQTREISEGERKLAKEIKDQGFALTKQVARMAEYRVEKANRFDALKALQQALNRAKALGVLDLVYPEARKIPETEFWRISIKSMQTWLDWYQPRGGDHGPESIEKLVSTVPDSVETTVSGKRQTDGSGSSVH